MRVRRVRVDTDNERLTTKALESYKGFETLTITVGGESFKGHVTDVRYDRSSCTGYFLLSEFIEVEAMRCR